LIGGQSKDDDIIGKTGKGFALVRGGSNRVRRGYECSIQIQLSTICGGGIAVGKVQEEVSDREKRTSFSGGSPHLFGSYFRSGKVPFREASAGLGEGLDTSSAVVGCILGAAGPKAGFVQLQGFASDAAEDSRSDASVANGGSTHNESFFWGRGDGSRKNQFQFLPSTGFGRWEDVGFSGREGKGAEQQYGKEGDF